VTRGGAGPVSHLLVPAREGRSRRPLGPGARRPWRARGPGRGAGVGGRRASGTRRRLERLARGRVAARRGGGRWLSPGSRPCRPRRPRGHREYRAPTPRPWTFTLDFGPPDPESPGPGPKLRTTTRDPKPRELQALCACPPEQRRACTAGGSGTPGWAQSLSVASTSAGVGVGPGTPPSPLKGPDRLPWAGRRGGVAAPLFPSSAAVGGPAALTWPFAPPRLDALVLCADGAGGSRPGDLGRGQLRPLGQMTSCTFDGVEGCCLLRAEWFSFFSFEAGFPEVAQAGLELQSAGIIGLRYLPCRVVFLMCVFGAVVAGVSAVLDLTLAASPWTQQDIGLSSSSSTGAPR
jgi:hypothetical protein